MAEIIKFLLYILLGQIFFPVLWILTLNPSDCSLVCLVVLPWNRLQSRDLSFSCLVNVSNCEIYALDQLFYYKQIIFSVFSFVFSEYYLLLLLFSEFYSLCTFEVTGNEHSWCFFFYKEKTLNKKPLCLVRNTSVTALERAASSHSWFNLWSEVGSGSFSTERGHLWTFQH